MPKRAYRFTYDGHEFTRATERVYTHVVLVRRDYQTELTRNIEGARTRAREDHPHYVQEGNPETRKYQWHSADSLAQYERIAKLTVDEYVAERVEAARDYVEKRRAKGEFDGCGPLTWCGRLELATREANKARASGYWCEVVIVPLEQP